MQINRQSERLAGKWLRVEVLEKEQEEAQPLPSSATASPEARAQAIPDWGYGLSPGTRRPFSDAASSRKSIYAAERY